MTTTHEELKSWVQRIAAHTQPDCIYWCDGSQSEYDQLVRDMLKAGELLKLNETTHPNCYLHRSDPNDVARTEHLTFICTPHQEEAGPNNNWMEPKEAHQKIDSLFEGCMKGRTMYVVPYCMGPIDSPSSRLGVEITDSAYVVINMRIMTRMGLPALKRIEKDRTYVKALHSTGDLSIENRLIMHFPEELTIKSIGSGYGGNALLGKKCHALRIGSYQAKNEGWLAEHMLILGIENPQGERHYIAAAFPSACGKTNLAMLIPPETYKGWKIWTVGDDIAWIHPNEDGKLYAINPEAGYFGVAPGTSSKTNPNALNMLYRDTIFTNVALTHDNQPWWEGLNKETPKLDWQGRPYQPENGPAAQPNSRFTVSAKQCASYTPEAENPRGVPLSAIIFGGRRPSLIPLVFEAKSWEHGVLVGAAVASETTAAATGKIGVLRRDSMAMKPFCGYNFGDYWQHWIDVGSKAKHAPKIFHVNWFRQDENGKFLWPGFGDNARVLEWIIRRCEGKADAVKTPIGYIPASGAIRTEGLSISKANMDRLCDVTPDGWKEELDSIGEYLDTFGDRLPSTLRRELEVIKQDLNR